MKKFLLISLFLTACFSNQDHVDGFSYIKDSRTDLCFAVSNMGTNQATITNVPCTDAVLKQIQLQSAQNSSKMH